jgi:uncharacterized protein (TIGR02265 family)
MRESVDYVFFEALFVRGLEVTGPLEQAMRERGFDRRVPQARYEAKVLEECLELARAAHLADLSAEDGLRELGKRFVIGFRETLVGTVLTAALPLLGPRRMLEQVPKRLPRVRSDLELTLESGSGDVRVLRAKDSRPKLGAFFAGVIQQGLEVAGARGHSVRLEPLADGYRLHVTLATAGR